LKTQKYSTMEQYRNGYGKTIPPRLKKDLKNKNSKEKEGSVSSPN
jgi:hypothetical protein